MGLTNAKLEEVLTTYPVYPVTMKRTDAKTIFKSIEAV